MWAVEEDKKNYLLLSMDVSLLRMIAWCGEVVLLAAIGWSKIQWLEPPIADISNSWYCFEFMGFIKNIKIIFDVMLAIL